MKSEPTTIKNIREIDTNQYRVTVTSLNDNEVLLDETVGNLMMSGLSDVRDGNEVVMTGGMFGTFDENLILTAFSTNMTSMIRSMKRTGMTAENFLEVMADFTNEGFVENFTDEEKAGAIKAGMDRVLSSLASKMGKDK